MADDSALVEKSKYAAARAAEHEAEKHFFDAAQPFYPLGFSVANRNRGTGMSSRSGRRARQPLGGTPIRMAPRATRTTTASVPSGSVANQVLFWSSMSAGILIGRTHEKACASEASWRQYSGSPRS